MMTNNPIFNLINLARTGGNPMTLMQQMAGRNPRAQQALQMVQGKTPDQLRQMAENMAKERGTTVDEIARGLGLK
ncbi:MAG: hypothetical protein KH202_05100 [Clostridiales bacterium]|jgi:hypothetical protein|nr:hypothetical protein [Clostridiales bacterium]DAZ60334.1 MAG TPA: helix-turn-helix, Psq domain [Caudoviricetes sp.]